MILSKLLAGRWWNNLSRLKFGDRLMAPRSPKATRGPGRFMPFVYILKSLKDGKLYVGSCANLDKRLQRHNQGFVKSTKSRRPLVILFSKEFITLSGARKFEWQLKYTPWGGKLKKELASKTAGSSNGRTADSGSANPGPNPGPAVLPTKRHKRT